MPVTTLINKIKQLPNDVEFDEVIAAINSHYDYTPTRFINGAREDRVINEAGKNEGSCRIFAFAKLHGLSEQETLACFGKFYREDVLGNPDGADHANIRTFMRDGWKGVQFDGIALRPHKSAH